MDTSQDKYLGIRTEGTLEILQKSAHYNRYEATPYAVLDEWFAAEPLRPGDHLVDFGCGKGRVPIYSAYRFGVTATGIDLNGRLLQEAYENLESFRTAHRKSGGQIIFEQTEAEMYAVQPEQNVFYFFNPFSLEIFQSVIFQMLDSLARSPRQADLILYYPTTAYVFFLEEQTPFSRIREIPIPFLSEDNEDERILIYRVG
ncbi:methyltransferase [Sporosarcina sp. NCCP-2716]|uniref:SAM-dependent methyltransferase n=1 Tax=Sporosarcina sp. NCCP-2716 TaxID=2943679 RepID=UPI00203DB995|nr:class I SAM-dependent methyltransferase [Sporosarcina sp. NCCP-2716]GKV68521.1 methyltransferase [Sporosarcina sp. NCCP-2716]